MADDAPQGETNTKAAAAAKSAAQKLADKTPADDSPAQDSATSTPKFSRERLLGEEGVTIVDRPAQAIAAALAGAEGDDFTRTEIRGLVDDFLSAPATLSTDDAPEG